MPSKKLLFSLTKKDFEKLPHVKGFRLYDIWCGMRQRCYNPKNKRYKYYGAKGIKVDPPWDEFEPFYYWAINNGYAENLTIDRKNSNKNYNPENCRWITVGENSIHAHLGSKRSYITKELISKKTKGAKNPMARPVRCVETGVVYATGREASYAIGLSYSAVGMCLCKKINTAGGFHWEYADKGISA